MAVWYSRTTSFYAANKRLYIYSIIGIRSRTYKRARMLWLGKVFCSVASGVVVVVAWWLAAVLGGAVCVLRGRGAPP